MTKRQKKNEGGAQPAFDDVLKRMLSSPPKQHKDERAKPKPTENQDKKKKPAT